MVSRSKEVAPYSEQVLDYAVGRGEALQMGRRFEAAHLALPLPGRLMRHFRAVVRVAIRAVHDGRHHDAVGRGVAAEFVGDQPAGETPLFFQQFPKEPDGGTPIPSRLDQDVEHIAILVHGAPEVLLATIDRHEGFVKVPGVAQPAAPLSESSHVGPSERSTPLPNRLVGDRDVDRLES